MGVSSDVVLSRELMIAIARGGPSSWEELAGVIPDAPYRLERFGEEILQVLKEAD